MLNVLRLSFQWPIVIKVLGVGTVIPGIEEWVGCPKATTKATTTTTKAKGRLWFREDVFGLLKVAVHELALGSGIDQ